MLKKAGIVLSCIVFVGIAATGSAQLISENFDGVTAPALPAGWTVENVNGDAMEWRTLTSFVCSSPNAANIHYNGSLAMDDWLFSPAVALSTGHTYTLTFNYRASYAIYPESLSVYIGTAANSAAMSTQLTDLPNIVNEACALETVTDFSVSASGDYYIGFHGYSQADRDDLMLDDVELVETSTPVDMMSFSIE